MSVDAEASADTCKGAEPVCGDTLNEAFGGASGAVTATFFVAVDERPPVSVTVMVTV